MKKGQVYEGTIEQVRFPDRGWISSSRPAAEEQRGEDASTTAEAESTPVVVKGTLPGQTVRFAVSKKRGERAEGRLLMVCEKSPMEMEEAACPHYGLCGGCSYQTLPYEEQLRLKSTQVLDLLREVVPDAPDLFEGVRPSPSQFGYRNKMEFTFGDEEKDGPLTLGLHKKGGIYDIVPVEHCRIVDDDFCKILAATQTFFREAGVTFYHRTRHEGWLRHLLVRKASRTGEILVDLVTTTQEAFPDLLEEWVEKLLSLSLSGKITGILHTKNDSPADAVLDEGTEILYGQDFFYEELLGMVFRITPFSFFQTNSSGAEVLYETARDFLCDPRQEDENVLAGKTVFDLYSGTGTIAQMLAPVCGRVVGVEIVNEAVEAARENAKENGIENCEFIAGDVLKVLDELTEKPDLIVLDPPRDGVHPKALKKIVGYGVEKMLYISCKPTSLARDLAVLKENGYSVKRLGCVDMFPGTVHIETVVLLEKSTTSIR